MRELVALARPAGEMLGAVTTAVQVARLRAPHTSAT
jgi:hypothetical protein